MHLDSNWGSSVASIESSFLLVLWGWPFTPSHISIVTVRADDKLTEHIASFQFVKEFFEELFSTRYLSSRPAEIVELAYTLHDVVVLKYV